MAHETESRLTTTPEELAAVANNIPPWARGTEARLVGASCNGVVNAWDLYRDGTLIGCMYDDGSGYIYIEGSSIADGDWDDSGMPWV